MALFEAKAGLISGTEASRGPIKTDEELQQCDYPSAWALHQIMAWVGLEIAQRMAYWWLWTMTPLHSAWPPRRRKGSPRLLLYLANDEVNSRPVV